MASLHVHHAQGHRGCWGWCPQYLALGPPIMHVVNGIPWWGASLLKCAVQGSKSVAPTSSTQPKCAPVTLAHLSTLRHSLDLNDTFDATDFGTATVAFWCQCCLAEVCMDSSFDPLIHTSCSCEGYTTPYNESPFPGMLLVTMATTKT